MTENAPLEKDIAPEIETEEPTAFLDDDDVELLDPDSWLIPGYDYDNPPNLEV